MRCIYASSATQDYNELGYPKYELPFSIDYGERKSHERGVYPTQYTSSMVTARVKQDEETDTRVIAKKY